MTFYELSSEKLENHRPETFATVNFNATPIIPSSKSRTLSSMSKLNEWQVGRAPSGGTFYPIPLDAYSFQPVSSIHRIRARRVMYSAEHVSRARYSFFVQNARRNKLQNMRENYGFSE